jgi:hypothetical protein
MRFRTLAYVAGAVVGAVAGALAGGAAFALVWTVSASWLDLSNDLESLLPPGRWVVGTSSVLGALLGLAAVARDLNRR